MALKTPGLWTSSPHSCERIDLNLCFLSKKQVLLKGIEEGEVEDNRTSNTVRESTGFSKGEENPGTHPSKKVHISREKM